MKLIYKVAVFLSLLVFFHTGKAQNSTIKPNLFNVLGNTLSCSVSELEKAFSSSPGANIKLIFGINIIFKGNVTSNVQRYTNLKSMVIKLTDFKDAALSISRRLNDDNTITYIGRIINENYADGYELKTDIAGNYFLNKIKTEYLIQDHQ